MLKTALAFLFILGLACGCAAPGAKRVARTYELPAVGSKAPDFWMKNQEQVRVSLSDFTGKKNVILVFFPLAFTPV
jgi:peroxiredoxin